MLKPTRLLWLVLSVMLAAGALVIVTSVSAPQPDLATAARAPLTVNTPGSYVVLSWNDLGMHCYNRDFNDLAVLPPANTLWAQVVRVGNPPQIITTGVTVEYFFADNTDSTSKSNFWSINPYSGKQNAQQLFGLSQPLPANMGLAGKSIAGAMNAQSDHFMAQWIPLTEFSDSNPSVRDPFQLATVVVRDANTHVELARTTVVAPVSTEMHCDNCHSNNGRGNEGISSPTVEQNILKKHDAEEGTHLMSSRPVLCASCHSSNALGAPGVSDVPSLSNAMHNRHQDVVPSTLDGCYNCHPGPTTRCLRDVMSQLKPSPLTCINCHGTMQQVAQNQQPWLNEPKCANCHTGGKFNQDQPLYRMSREHGGIYCEACHDSTHAIAPSSQPKDGLKFLAMQGHPGPIDTCTVCHSASPAGAGPHGITPPVLRMFSFSPNHLSASEPGAQVIYTHTLQNTGSLTDTYQLTWNSTQPWTKVSATTPITLTSGQTSVVTVTVNVSNTINVIGLLDTTIITASSSVSPTLSVAVTDITLVPRARLYLPLIMK